MCRRGFVDGRTPVWAGPVWVGWSLVWVEPGAMLPHLPHCSDSPRRGPGLHAPGVLPAHQ